MAKKKLRKVWVLREVEIKFEDMRKGDIFRLGKATPKDCVNESQWAIALGMPYAGAGQSKNHTVDNVDVAIVHCAIPKFSR